MKYCNILDKREIKQKIEESLKRTKDTGREHGFNFCVSHEKVITTMPEEGEKDSLGMEKMCPLGAKTIGAVHIHTKPSIGKDAVPSPADIKKGMAENMIFFCVGTNVNSHGIVRCFGKRDLEEEMTNIFKKLQLGKLGLREMEKDIDRSTRLITGRMTVYQNYLDKHSCQRIYGKD